MRRFWTFAAILALAPVACRTAEVESGPPIGAQPAPPTADAIPAGTLLEVELDQTIGTERNRVGDRFTATVTDPLIAQNGQVVVPRGSVVHGVITGLDPSSNIGDQAAIRVHFDRITIGNRGYPFSADVVRADAKLEGPEGRRVAEHAAIGAVAGAALGVIIGEDLAGALIGGALGAGVGTIISLGIGDVDAELPAGTAMTLRTAQTISLR